MKFIAFRNQSPAPLADKQLMVLELSSQASNCVSRQVHLVFFVFDVLMLEGRDVTGGPRSKRRMVLEKHTHPRLSEPIRDSTDVKANLADLIRSVKSQALEGLVANPAQ